MRRPLAACRAALFASLVDDSDSDPMYRGHAESAAAKRAELFDLIEELIKWENSNNPDVLNRARAEIARCVASAKVEAGEWSRDTELSLASPAPSTAAVPPHRAVPRIRPRSFLDTIDDGPPDYHPT